MKYLFDTNILIYFFNGSLPDELEDSVAEMMKESFGISVISKMEFLGFDRFSDIERKKARHFLSFAKVLPLDDAVVEYVIKMKQTRKIKLPDGIIAATAILGDFHLVTRNVEDFNNIDVKLINPFQ